MLAAIGLAGAGLAKPEQAGDVAFVALCGDPTRLIPVPGGHNDKPHDPCPMGCHALCSRRDGTEEED